MNILFASNDPSDFVGVSATTTSTNYYDSQYSDLGIGFKEYVAGSHGNGPHKAPSGDTVWYHWLHASNTTMSSTHDGGLVQIEDVDGNTIAEIRHTDGYQQARVIGDATVDGALSPTRIPSALKLLIDVKIVVNSSEITMELYESGMLVSTATTTNSVGRGVARKMIFRPHDFSGAYLYISEFIVAEESTIGCRVSSISVDALGSSSDWGSDVTAMNDRDASTNFQSTVAGDRQMMGLETYSNGDSITAVVVSAVAAAGSLAPSNLALSIRSGGTNYDGAAQPLTDIPETVQEVWLTDPADGTDWTAAKVNAIEAGFVSSA